MAGSVISVITSDFHSLSNNFFLGMTEISGFGSIGVNKVITLYRMITTSSGEVLTCSLLQQDYFHALSIWLIFRHSRIYLSEINMLVSVALQL